MTTAVVILTLNAGDAFEETLDRVVNQSPPADDVLIVDSGSSDDTIARVRARGLRLHSIAPAEFDFGLTRDLGFELTDADLIASLSQDVAPKDSSWLRTLTAPLVDDHRVALVSARCEARDPESMFLWQRLGKFYFTREMTRFRERYGTPCSHANSCVRRSAWESVRHGPMPIAEDLLLQTRLIHAGHELAWIDEPIAWHQHAYTARQVFRRAWNEGLAARRLDVPYGVVDALADATRLDIWLTLARQVRYGRARSAADLLYPALRPLALFGGRKLGRRYWR